uniref:Uncharacterized protein n=1 Tax=Acrobeloides nanus TaxID=290746 RepID=A0A914D8B5_9BILA
MRSKKSTVKDEARSGRPSTFNEDELRRLVEENPKRTTRKLAAILQKDKALVWRLYRLLAWSANSVFGYRISSQTSTKGRDN